MADYGEWNRKGGTLSDATAIKDGVTHDFIVEGIRAGKIRSHRSASPGGSTVSRFDGLALRYCSGISPVAAVIDATARRPF
jgi:hypothetical protein